LVNFVKLQINATPPPKEMNTPKEATIEPTIHSTLHPLNKGAINCTEHNRQK
jgi:hypothetical protein